MTADSSFTEGASHSGGALDLSAPQAVQESLRQLYDTLDLVDLDLSVANTAMRLFVSELDRRLLYQEAVETLTTLLDLRVCTLFLYDEERNEVTLCAAWGIVPDVLARLRTRAIDLAAPDLVARCLRERRMVRAVSSADDAHATSLFGLPIQGVGTLVAKPLFMGKRAVGVVVVSPRGGVDTLAGAFTHRLNVLGDALSAALGHDATHQRKLDQLKTDIVDVLSHELRTPLTSILGYTEVLVEGEAGAMTEEQQTYLRIIESSGHRLQRQVENLLTLSRLRAGELAPQPRTIALQRYITAAVESMRAQAVAKEQALLARIPDSVPSVQAEPELVQQIMTHLLENALKFAPERGAIQVAANREEDRAIVSVMNRGSYIPEGEQAYLFDMFYRTAAAERDAVQRAGLGLAIVRGLVERSGGHIWVCSHEDEGTTFSFSLPVARSRASDGQVH